MLEKEVRYKKLHTVRFHVYEMIKQGKSIEKVGERLLGTRSGIDSKCE